MARAKKWLRLCGVVASGLLIGCEPDPRFMPVCEIQAVEHQPEVFMIKGEPDAGYKVLVRLKNIGQAGEFRVRAAWDFGRGYGENQNHFASSE